MLSGAKVIESEMVASGIFSLLLEEKRLAEEARPGQFIHLRLNKNSSAAPLLRRPFSIAGAFPERGFLQIVFQLRGEGTKTLSSLQGGDELDCLGPLGSGFQPGEDSQLAALLVGGGIGVAPLLFLAQTLLQSHKRVLLFYGAARLTELIPLERFLPPGVEVYLATDDGSAGFQGFVTDMLHFRLQKEGRLPAEIFACGPRLMMKRLAGMEIARDMRMQLSLEEMLACGIGACHGCAVETSRGIKKETEAAPGDGAVKGAPGASAADVTGGADGEAASGCGSAVGSSAPGVLCGVDETVFSRICRDGPVFNSFEVVW
jgi:dihydroorotate dehydrogenase electron transfer subunit